MWVVEIDLISVGGGKLDFYPNEIDLVVVWVVAIDLILVWGSESTWFCVAVQNDLSLVFVAKLTRSLPRGIEINSILEWDSK